MTSNADPSEPDGLVGLNGLNGLAERFTLRPIDKTDLPLLTSWMNDPAVDRYWRLAGPQERTAAHLDAVADAGRAGFGTSTSYLGLLDGEPISYWELYRADLDALAAHYDATPHDGGIHLLLGPARMRGKGLGAALIELVASWMLDADPAMQRVVAEPDVTNTASVRAFARAGFPHVCDLELPDKRAALMVLPRVLDVVGVGIGPFNLALAALIDGMDRRARPTARFFDGRPAWSWHPGLLFDDARLQVPFLADLVTLVDPTSQWSYLAYLRAHDRLFPFYFAERFHVPRTEYDQYCRWVADGLPACRFGRRVTEIDVADDGTFTVRIGDERTGARRTVQARNVVLGIGTEPALPDGLRDLPGHLVFPAADYLTRRTGLADLRDITVVGSGQSGAEVFLDLLRTAPADGGPRLRWLTRSAAFAPMEYSKLGLEHFTPDYARYFRSLPPRVRQRRLATQGQLYKAISVDTIGAIYDLLYERSVGGSWPDVELRPNTEVVTAGLADAPDTGRIELGCRHIEADRDVRFQTDAVVVAAGYTARRPPLSRRLREAIRTGPDGRPWIGEDYRMAVDSALLDGRTGEAEDAGGLYVQNAELHTHGVGAPDLGLGAYRAAVILNAICADHTAYRLPPRTAFTTFGLEPADVEPDPPPAESDEHRTALESIASAAPGQADR